jgi:formate dehydrogenase iron-sulfur subunit
MQRGKWMSTACLFDTTLCIGCRACQVACKAWNEMPPEQTRFRGTGGGGENPGELSAKTYTRITFHELPDAMEALERSVFVKRQCMHCLDPACVAACPVAALQKIDNGASAGAVVYEPDKCLGCRYCMLACPFSVPKFEWDKRVPLIRKCTLCFDRLEKMRTETHVNDHPLATGSQARFNISQRLPACVKVCPTGAIITGAREALIAEGRRRIAARKNKTAARQYVDHIYGEGEAGGTGWLYLADVPFERLGFNTNLALQPYRAYTDSARTGVAPAVLGAGAVLGGLCWIVQRRNELQEQDMEEKKNET